MREFSSSAGRAVLNDPSFVVPAVPPARSGVAGLRALVGRFSSGADQVRRRALSVAVLDAIRPGDLRPGPDHPVTALARAMGVEQPVTGLVREVAAAYQPGTGDEAGPTRRRIG